MSEANSNWSTEFDTVNQTMTNIFSKRIKSVTDWKTNTLSVYKDGEIKNRFSISNLPIGRFHNRLISIAESAKILDEIS